MGNLLPTHKIFANKNESSKKIISVSLNSCTRAKRQKDKYLNLLIFITLPGFSEME